ncbi:hypothetical protein OROGR_032431 [Orobanche gracilis]
MASATASLGWSSLFQSISGASRGEKHSLSAPNSLTPTRRKSRAVVKATSRVGEFSKNDIIVSPSILSANFSKLGEQVKAMEFAGCDWIHVDVMDGRFVPNITIGPLVVDLVLIMSVNPGFGGQSFIENQGVNPWIEVDGGVGPMNAYKSYIYIGVLVNQADREPLEKKIGQTRIELELELDQRELAREQARLVFELESITFRVIEAGANALVAGSAVFGAPDYAQAIKGIKTSKRPVVVPV